MYYKTIVLVCCWKDFPCMQLYFISKYNKRNGINNLIQSQKDMQRKFVMIEFNNLSGYLYTCGMC